MDRTCMLAVLLACSLIASNGMGPPPGLPGGDMGGFDMPPVDSPPSAGPPAAFSADEINSGSVPSIPMNAPPTMDSAVDATPTLDTPVDSAPVVDNTQLMPPAAAVQASTVLGPPAGLEVPSVSGPPGAAAQLPDFSGPPSLGGGDLSTMEGPPFDMVSSSFDPNGVEHQKELLINNVDANNHVNPEAGAAGFASGFMQQNQELGVDSTNSKGAFDMAPAIADALSGPPGTQNTDWADGNNMPNNVFELENAPFSDMFSDMNDSFGTPQNGMPSFGAGNMAAMPALPDLPPMEPMPPPPPEPEEPPPLPEELEPLGGDVTKCQGGHIADISQYESCNVISGFLSLDNIMDNGLPLVSLDSLSAIHTIELDTSFINNGLGLSITNNPELSSLSGLSGLSGAVPGALVIENNPKLDSINGLSHLTGFDTTTDGDSIVIGDMAQLGNVDGLSGVSGALPGAIVLNNLPALNSIQGLSNIVAVGSDQNGVGVQIDNTGLLSVDGLGSISAVGGSLTVSNNDQLQNLDGASGISTLGKSSGGVSIHVLGNSALQNVNGLKSVVGEVPGSVQIAKNPMVSNLDGLRGISSVGKDSNETSVILLDNPSLQNIDGLTDVAAMAGGVRIEGNSKLQNLDGFKNTKIIGSDKVGVSVGVVSNENLVSMDGLGGIASTPGAVQVHDNPNLQSIGLKDLQTIGADSSGVSLELSQLSNVNNLDGLNNLQSTDGGIAISNMQNLGSLRGMEHLSSVGRASKTGRSMEIIQNTGLKSVALPSLTSVPGGVLVQGNADLTSMSIPTTSLGMDTEGRSLEVLDNKQLGNIGMNSLETAEGSVAVARNDGLTNMAGLNSLKTVGQDSSQKSLSVLNNAHMTDLSGLSSLEAVPGGLSIQENNELTSLGGLDSLTQVGADSTGHSVEVVGNGHLTSLHGLEGITSLPGSVTVVRNENLQNLNGLGNVVSVGQDDVGRSLEIVSNANLQSLNGLEKVNGALPGGIEVAGNAALKDISALTGIESVGAGKDGVSVLISNNDVLPDVGGLSTVSSVTGSVEITKNSALQNLDGLSHLESVGSDNKGVSVAIDSNAALKSTEGMSGVTGEVAGSVLVRKNPVLELLYGFDGATSIGKDASGNSFEVTENDMLAKLEAMRACTKFEGALVLQKNPILKSLQGLQKITEIKGKNLLGDSLLVYANKELLNLEDLSGLHGKLEGAISIAENSHLTSLNGLEGITGVGSSNTYGNALEVIKNDNLQDVDGLSSITGTLPGAISVEQNAQLGNLNGLHGVTGISGANNAGESLVVFKNQELTNLDGLGSLGGALPGGVVVSGNTNLESISGLEGDSPITSSGKVVIEGVKCLSKDEVTYLKSLCKDTDPGFSYSSTTHETAAKCRKRIQKVMQCAGPSTATVLVGAGKGKVCGGNTKSDGWTAWELYGNTGLYIDVDTTKCDFTLTPNYVASITGDSGHWQLVGVNSIYKPTSRGFRVYLWHPSLKGSFMAYFAKRYKWSIGWMADTGRTGGQTRPGKSGWKQFAKDTLYLDVDTSLSQYKTNPAYVTSMHGAADHWRSTGVHSIYNPTKTGFRVYVMHASGNIAAVDAERHQWSLSWIGSESKSKAGHSSTNWKVFCASKDQDCGAVAHFYSIYVDVPVSGKYDTTPTYVTSVGGTAHHLVVTGAGSIYRASKEGFRTYLDKAPSPQVAKMASWEVNWMAYEDARDCTQSKWGEWEECTVSCGGGTSSRRRETLIAENEYGSCPEIVQSGACNTFPCPENCEVSGFSGWEDCSVTCGSGTSTRKRAVVMSAAHGGKVCPPLVEHKPCEQAPCTVHCEVSEWSEFTQCTRSCGFGFQSRTRTILTHSDHGGRGCPHTQEQQPCNFHPCPIDCLMGAWTPYEPCSLTCTVEGRGHGTHQRSRYVMIPSFFGGKQCASTKEVRTCDPGLCPKHCDVSQWGPYGNCDKSCDGGSHTRTRIVIKHPEHGGYECPSLQSAGRCNTHHCPRDCVVEDWRTWSKCSRSCGTGYQRRFRRIVQPSLGGGSVCPVLSEFQGCNRKQCPIDCKVTDYGIWSQCSVSCGSGTTDRRRSVRVSSAYGGKACPTLIQSNECHSQTCPDDCQVTDFSDWNSCSSTCGAASQTRTRRIVSQPKFGGVACPKLIQQQGCNEGQCPVHCEVWAWSPWSGCTKTCGSSRQIRSRTVKKHAMHGGYACPFLRETRTCATRACPGDCEVSEYMKWLPCSVSCGTGAQTRHRVVLVNWSHGGKQCPSLVEHRKCNAQHCAVDCKVSGYGPWSSCSKTCGTGVHTRGRSVLSSHLHGGKKCPALVQEEDCHIRSCPVDCVVGHWEDWNSCTRTCGTGFQERHRSVATNTAYGGESCRHLYEHRICNGQSCPIDCIVSEWDLWSKCSRTCGTGRQTRTRSVLRNWAFGGVGCAALEDRRDCHGDACAVDCAVTKWSDWGSCSKTCGRGTQSRKRYVSIPPVNGGVACPPLSETFHCTQGPCPVGCQVAKWTDWSQCSHSCGGGKHERHRRIISHAKHGGYTCPDLEQMKSCNSDRCAVDCVVTGWREWSPCSRSCDTGSQSRTRSVVIGMLHGGKGCPALMVQKRCNIHACAIDCIVTNFAPWTGCSRTCGQGHKTRARSVAVEHAFGGRVCPVLEERLACGMNACPIDCLVSEWNEWSHCTQTCDGGSQTRTRSVYQNTAYGGSLCPVLRQTQLCNHQMCPVDCVLADWGDWSGCSTSCGMGTHGRTRQISTMPGSGGKACAPRVEIKDCVEYTPCPIHCEVSPYSGWTTCTNTCGGGTQTRTRTIVGHSAFGGYTCPNLVDEQPCRTQPCPVDCVVTKYGEWSACTHTCGTGYQSRSRTATTAPQYGGKSCPVMQEVTMCATHFCPIDCQTSDWSDWNECSRTCGVGTKYRNRNILRSSAYGGQVCPSVSANANCNSQACPTNCRLSPYSEWSECSVSCGTGSRTKTRSVQRNAVHGGMGCASTTLTSDCNTQLCPVNCEYSRYSDWSACVYCGAGSQTRTRRIAVHVAYGGEQCSGATKDVQSCSLGPCHQHCTVSEWGDWTTCDKSCGGGFMRRTRSVVKQQTWGGDECPHMTEVERCNSDSCPVDCVIKWTKWSSCDRTCGIGYQDRTGTVIRRPKHGGAGCPSTNRHRRCNTQFCPINCVVSAFGDYTDCSKTCGSGVQTRHRGVTQDSGYGGTRCPALSQDRDCATEACAVDCDVTAFSSWTECTQTCGSGDRLRTRSINRPALNGGSVCPHLVEHGACNTQACPVDCVISDFGDWGVCSASCGTGFQVKSRSVHTSSLHGGLACGPLHVSRYCNTHMCPTDCMASPWSDWTECTATCGDGSRIRHRSINRREGNGGKPCPALTEESVCAMGSCPMHCEVSTWAFWSECTVSCGTGKRTRTRNILKHASFGGYTCPLLSDTKPCGLENCPVDCGVTWTAWSDCTESCGTGSQSRTRTIVRSPRYGGAACPPEIATQYCAQEACAIDCVVGTFAEWSDCSRTCGTGYRERSRSVQISNAYGGLACPELTELLPCKLAHCPVDCVVTDFTQWGACTKSCGTGSMTRTRSISVAAAWGGKQCRATSETFECNHQICPSDCSVSSWSAWGSCSTTCGDGTVVRTRTIVGLPRYGGHVCPPLIDREDCQDNAPCPVHCKVTDWTRWSECSHTCGTGSKARTRSITQHSQYGGFVCPQLRESLHCRTTACPVNCVVSDFSDWQECTATCNGGVRRRTRSVNVASAFGGVVCPALQETKPCNAHECVLTSVTTLDFKVIFSCATRFETGAFQAILADLTGLDAANIAFTTQTTADASFTGNVISADAQMEALFQLYGFSDARRLVEQDERALAHAVAQMDNCPRGGCLQTYSIAKNMQANFEVDVVIKMDFSSNQDMVKATLASMYNVEQHDIHVQLGDPRNFKITVKINGDHTISFQTAAQVAAGLREFRGEVVGDIVTKLQTVVKNALKIPSVAEVNSAIPGATFTQATVQADVTLSVTDDVSKLQNIKENVLDDLRIFAADLMARSGIQGEAGSPCPDPAVGPIGPPITTLNSDCQVSSWSTYDACTKSCGGGSHTRTRTITKHAEADGKPCPYLVSHKTCNFQACPVDCVPSVWSPWGLCTETCGTGGKQARTRVPSVETRHGGKECPALFQEKACNNVQCPENCEMHPWSDWSECSSTCGADGEETATRTVKSTPSYGGMECPSGLTKTQSCNMGECPRNCIMSEWSIWSECTRTCGGGSHSRTRSVVTHPTSGYTCPSAKEDQSCKTDSCPIDCKLSRPSRWGKCSTTCGRGREVRTRKVQRAAQFNGLPCIGEIESRGCNDFACPGDCHLSKWSEWTPCSLTCHSGSQKRSRTVVTEATYGGQPCEHLAEQQSCNETPCPTDCAVGAFGKWTSCSASCGSGQMTREREITLAPAHGGAACPVLVDQLDCNTQNCAVDCQVSQFSDWSVCSVTCGTGSKSRSRSIEVATAHGGKPCPAIDELQQCNLPNCAVDCITTKWDAWHSVICSHTCGGGIQRRERSIARAPEYGGRSCGSLTDTRECATHLCPVDCETTEWSDWTECTLSCGEGTQTRTRTVTTPPSSGGKACGVLHFSQTCVHYLPCPVHCEVSEFTQWQHDGVDHACSKTCGTGSQTRSRTIIAHAQFGGYTCPDLAQTQNCNTHCCPVNCEVGSWTRWSDCSASCGTGYHLRSRVITQNTTCGGVQCPFMDDRMECNTHQCPKNCEVSDWGLWSACSRSCGGGGSKTRTRSIQSPGGFGGEVCPVLQMTKACNSQCCPVDAEVSTYGVWSQCSRSCGGGSRTRSRQVTKDESCGGRQPPTLFQTERCNSHCCPVNCQVGEFSDWSTCTKSCTDSGGRSGTRKRFRSVLRTDACGGISCGTIDLKQEVECNRNCCPVDCQMGEWTSWASPLIAAQVAQAEVVCGKQQHSNKKGCLNPGMKGKTEKHEVRCCSDTAKAGWTKHNDQCPYAESVVPRCFHNKNFAEAESICAAEGARLCTADELKNDCTGGTGCMHDVDLIWTSTVPTVTVPAGRACGGKTQNQPCNRFACPVDCQVGDWTDFGICSLTCSAHGTKGTETRVRERLVDAGAGGQECPALTETRSCWGGECPIHCEVSAWSEWTTCTKTCTDGEDGVAGRHAHSRTIVRHAAHGGYVCPTLNEDLPCNEHLCPVDCEVGQWSGWAPYHKGGHNLKRTRPVLTPAAHGGVDCPATENLKIFHHQTCNKEQTGEWSDCSKSCGTDGRRFRSHEFIKCSEHAALRLHIQYMHKGLCNIKQCETEEEAAQPHAEVYAPEIDSVAAADEMQLVESIGNWVPVTQEDVDAYGLTEQDQMQKFVPSS